MSILADKNTKLICQGITGSAGAFHTATGRSSSKNLDRDRSHRRTVQEYPFKVGQSAQLLETAIRYSGSRQ